MFVYLSMNLSFLIRGSQKTRNFDASAGNGFIFSTVPQLSKCLKFEAVWGVLN